MAELEFRYYDTLANYKQRIHSGKRFNSKYMINLNTIRRCAIVVGRNPWSSKDPLEVLKWRLSLINSFIEILPSGMVSIKNINYLETTEKGSVGYMLGMIFTQIFAQELLNIRQLLHLNSEEVIVTTKGKSPDLCGYNKSQNRAYLLEAKGSTVLSNKLDNTVVDTACKQLESVSDIQFTRIKGKFSSASLTKYVIGTHPDLQGNFEQEIVDPEEEKKVSIIVDSDLMILKHYFNTYTLLKKYKEEQFFYKKDFIAIKIKESDFNLGMLKKIYDYLDPIYEEVSDDMLKYAANIESRKNDDIYNAVNTELDEWQQNNKKYFNTKNSEILDTKLNEASSNEEEKHEAELKSVDAKDSITDEEISIGIDGICVF